ncbi:AraC family transcriptional regulator [Christensenellaceae bacterium OttesenSCG-928-M15]|nr:AraC family transcriptional regulator [Christensenellaceae bacterium OttesenSCG-928-M15]
MQNPLKQMNEALVYMEENLTNEIDFEHVARIAGCSQYHFRRMFSYLAGMPLGEYIRCRKLSVAGELLRGGSKVIDCAVLLGYESADAFSKAFQGMHGIPPSEAKRSKATLKAFPPMSFQLTIRGGMRMEYRIVHNSPFRIVGYKKRITLQFEGVNKQMDTLVQKPTPESIRELKGLCNIEPSGMLSVSANFSERTTEGTELDQYIGVATTLPAPDGYDVLEVDEADWAVFTVVGPFPKAMQDTWARIYAEWLPSSEYQLTGGPELLWHESPDLTKPDCKSEIWIPVSKR